MTVIAVIPARGGSKGLPGKNIRPLGGIPLVARSIKAALASTKVDRVYVSSDDEAILAVAREWGGEAIRRPDALSGDTASSESALLHALDVVQEDGVDPAIIVFMQCTSPFTTAADIDAVVGALEAQKADCAFSAVEDHGFIWQVDDASGQAVGITHDHTKPRQRRQEMKPRFRETGALYAMRVAPFRAVGNRFCGRSVLVPLHSPPLEIDTAEDWALASLYAESGSAPTALTEGALRRLKALVTDFDGVHTDDTVFVDQDGVESVRCNRRDGMGIERLRASGLRTLILSKETNPVVARRAAKLKMEVIHGVDRKVEILARWLADNGLGWDEIAYVGNDINDLECMERAGISFAPSDADGSARRVASLVLSRPGGQGALREVCDTILQADPQSRRK